MFLCELLHQASNQIQDLNLYQSYQKHPCSVYVSYFNMYVTTPITSVPQAKLERASRTRIPSAVADIVTEACLSVEIAVKRHILH